MENIISQIFAATALISTLSEDRLPAVLHDDHRAMLIPLIRNTMLNIATKLLPVIDDIDISDTNVAITFNPAIAKAGLSSRIDALVEQACAYHVLAIAFDEASPGHAAHFRTVAEASVDMALEITSFITAGGSCGNPRALRIRPHIF